MTAKPGASKPVSSGSTAKAVADCGAASTSCQRVHAKRVADAVLGEKRGEPLLGALAPAGDEHALAFAFEPSGMGDHGVEDIAAFASARSAAKDRPCLPPNDTTVRIARGLGMLERDRARFSGAPASAVLPVGLGEKQALGRHRIIGRRAEGLALQRLLARLVMVLDLLEPLRPRVVVQRIEGHDRVRQIVEQRLQPLMEQRQPMLHALMLAPGGDRLVERIVAAAPGRTARHSGCGSACAPPRSAAPRSWAAA